MTNLDEQIREVLFNWHQWRDYYYSDLQEQVITDDEWIVTRDKIDYDATEKIKAIISDQVAKARIEELRHIREFWGRAKDDTLSSKPFNFVALSDIDNRITQLRSTPND